MSLLKSRYKNTAFHIQTRNKFIDGLHSSFNISLLNGAPTKITPRPSTSKAAIENINQNESSTEAENTSGLDSDYLPQKKMKENISHLIVHPCICQVMC